MLNEGGLTVDAAMAEDGIANLGSKDEIEGHRRSVATRTTNVCRDPFNLTGAGFAPSNFFVIRIGYSEYELLIPACRED